MIISIRQLKDEKLDTCGYAFRGYVYAMNNGFNFKDYEEVYDMIYIPNNDYKVLMTEDDKYRLLDKMFDKFNRERPEDFKGHSLSVSDLVCLGDEIYYCDRFGWERI